MKESGELVKMLPKKGSLEARLALCNWCVCEYVCVRVSVYMWVWVCTCEWCVWVCTCECVHVSVWCVWVYMWVCGVWVCTCECVVCVCVYMWVCGVCECVHVSVCVSVYMWVCVCVAHYCSSLISLKALIHKAPVMVFMKGTPEVMKEGGGEEGVCVNHIFLHVPRVPHVASVTACVKSSKK